MSRTSAIAKRLEDMGVDPLENLVRIAMRAEAAGNLALAAKTWGDLMQYMAPKLKSMEVAFEPETLRYLDRQQRLTRIGQLMRQVGYDKSAGIIEGSCERLPAQLNAEPSQE